MGATAKLVLSCIVLCVLSGCAGTDFVRPDPESFKYGQTNQSVVVAKMGPPRQTGSLVKNEKNITTMTYAYAAVGGKAHREGVTPARSAAFFFYDNLLVGSEFVSSWADDNTDFDESRVPGIIKGTTTRAEVLKLFGKPGGVYVYPMIKTPGTEAAVYAYVETRGTAFNLRVFRKVLIVSFDANGVVSDVEFVTGSVG